MFIGAVWSPNSQRHTDSEEQANQFVRDVVVRGLQRAGLKRAAAAAMMGISESTLSSQLHRRHGFYLSVQRLILIDSPVFWESVLSDFRERLISPSTEDVEAATERCLLAISSAVRRMAKVQQGKKEGAA